MIERFKQHPFEIIGAMITLANVTLIWLFRFLPLYDYPIWLYEIRIMRAIAAQPFAGLYEWSFAPIPNLGFVIPVWLMSYVVPLEVAGKIFLTCSVIGLPWSFWFLVRRLSAGAGAPLAFFGFPFAFNIFFFGGHAFLAGMIALFLMMGFYVPRLRSLEPKSVVALSLLFVMLYLMHAFVFFAGALIFLSAAALEKEKQLGWILASLIPSVACLVRYAGMASLSGEAALHWSAWSIMQNVFRPVFLFIKSYGIGSPVPLTLLNIAWVVVIGVLILVTAFKARGLKQTDKRFVFPVVVMLLLTLMLPETFIGVKHAGSRFGFCLMFLSILMSLRATVSPRWKPALLLVALLVNMYSMVHFTKVNQQMEELYADLTSNFTIAGKSFRSFRFDYPPSRDLRDVAAASVDPLFGVASYAALDSGGASWIFGTSLLRYSWEGRKWNPHPADGTKAELAANLLGARAHLPYTIVVSVGEDRTIDSLVQYYRANKVVAKQHWTIVESVTESTLRDGGQ